MRSISLNTALAISVRLFIGLTGASILRRFRCIYWPLQPPLSLVLLVGFDKLKNLSNQDSFCCSRFFSGANSRALVRNLLGCFSQYPQSIQVSLNASFYYYYYFVLHVFNYLGLYFNGATRRYWPPN